MQNFYKNIDSSNETEHSFITFDRNLLGKRKFKIRGINTNERFVEENIEKSFVNRMAEIYEQFGAHFLISDEPYKYHFDEESVSVEFKKNEKEYNILNFFRDGRLDVILHVEKEDCFKKNIPPL